MPKTPTEKIRQLWIIYFLLDCNEWKQKDIENELLSYANPPIDDSEEDIRMSVTKKVSKSLNLLEDENIVVCKSERKPRNNFWRLCNDKEALFKILKKLYDPYPSEYSFSDLEEFKKTDFFLKHIKNIIMTSEYAKTIITPELIKKFEEDLDIVLTVSKSRSAYIILRTSPKALLNTFRYIENIKLVKIHNVKENWLYNLQVDFFSDIKNPDFIRPYGIHIEQKIVTSVNYYGTEEEKEIDFQIEAPLERSVDPKKGIRKLKYSLKDVKSPLGIFRKVKKK